MPFCHRCGSFVSRDDERCPSCGLKQKQETDETPVTRPTSTNVPNAVNAYARLIAAASYLGLLVVVPILFRHTSKSIAFHANQGLVLLLFSYLAKFLCYAFRALVGLSPYVRLVVVLFQIYGILCAVTDKERKLPLIGRIQLLKTL